MANCAEEWLDELSPEDLPEPYKSMLNDCQIPAKCVNMLTKRFGGGMVYFPKLDKYIIRIRNEKIRAEFNGHNYSELARKYGMTETWIREIVARTIAGQGYTQDELFI